jgi:phosphomannomutase
MSLIKSISGIRGTIGGPVGEGLTPLDIVKFTTAYAQWVRTNTPHPSHKIVVGRDARISGEMVFQTVSGTLMGMGFDVVNLGLASTPTTELAVVMEGADGGIILTASHNPKHWNALKLLNHEGEFLNAQEGAYVLKVAESEAFDYAPVERMGRLTNDFTYAEKHVQAVVNLPLVDVEAIRKAGFKVVIDSVNSVGGIVLPELLQALGVREVVSLNGTPDGIFPHNPEPLPEHLTQIADRLQTEKADVGFVVDPDVDRLAIVCENGDMFGEEYTLVAVADYVLSHTPGNTVSNLSSTRALSDVTLAHGGSYTAAAVGEVNVVTAMKASRAVIGGEGNGGVIYPESHYGRDALVGIALFLSHLAHAGTTVSTLRASYPSYYIDKQKMELTPEIDVDAILVAVKQHFANERVNDIDGVKIDFPDRWVHLRKSNTEPIVRIYSEAPSKAEAEALSAQLKTVMASFL